MKNSASYKITLKDLANQAEFVQYLKGLSGVRKVLSSEVTADGVAALNSVVSYASVGIIVILLLVSVFLISNTITIGITVRKEEIGIMKLIGATNFFVRAPFIVEGIVIGLIGSLIPLVLVYYMYDTVIQYIIGRFSVVQNLFAFVPVKEIFAVLIPLSAYRHRTWPDRKYIDNKKTFEGLGGKSMKCKKFVRAMIAFVVAGSMSITVNATSISDLKDQKDQKESKKAEAEAVLEQLQSEQKSILDAIEELDAQVTEYTNQITELEGRQTQLESDIEQKQTELAAAGEGTATV